MIRECGSWRAGLSPAQDFGRQRAAHSPSQEIFGAAPRKRGDCQHETKQFQIEERVPDFKTGPGNGGIKIFEQSLPERNLERRVSDGAPGVVRNWSGLESLPSLGGEGAIRVLG